MSESNDRLDRVEKILEQLAEEQKQLAEGQKQLAERQKETERNLNLLIINTDKAVARNAEQIARTDRLARDVLDGLDFLRTAVQGHLSEPSPPAHGAD